MARAVFPTIDTTTVEPHYSINRRFLPATTLDGDWVATQLAWRDARLAALEKALDEFRWSAFVPRSPGSNVGDMVYVNTWVRERAAEIVKENARG